MDCFLGRPPVRSGRPARTASRHSYSSLRRTFNARANAEGLSPACIRRTAAALNAGLKTRFFFISFSSPFTVELSLISVSHLRGALHLLSLFEEKQYRFVTLAEAQSDPAYATPDGPPTRFGPMWGYRWAREKGVTADGRMEPELPPWVHEYGK